MVGYVGGAVCLMGQMKEKKRPHVVSNDALDNKHKKKKRIIIKIEIFNK